VTAGAFPFHFDGHDLLNSGLAQDLLLHPLKRAVIVVGAAPGQGVDRDEAFVLGLADASGKALVGQNHSDPDDGRAVADHASVQAVLQRVAHHVLDLGRAEMAAVPLDTAARRERARPDRVVRGILAAAGST
jgi:hypothetical protein